MKISKYSVNIILRLRLFNGRSSHQSNSSGYVIRKLSEEIKCVWTTNHAYSHPWNKFLWTALNCCSHNMTFPQLSLLSFFFFLNLLFLKNSVHHFITWSNNIHSLLLVKIIEMLYIYISLVCCYCSCWYELHPVVCWRKKINLLM